MKDYQQDWKEATAMLTEALQKREALDAKIEILHKRVQALEILTETNDRHKGKPIVDQQTTAVEALVNVAKPRVTERVRGLLAAANGPLTAPEILTQLKQLGWTLNPEAQPLAFMYGIGRRLEQQGFANRVEKDGRVAWARKTTG